MKYKKTIGVTTYSFDSLKTLLARASRRAGRFEPLPVNSVVGFILIISNAPFR